MRQKKRYLFWCEWNRKRYIHVIRFCILYRNEFEDLRRRPRCGLSRYKVKVGQKEYNDEVIKEGPLAKVVWYLPIIPRLKHLFSNTYDVKNLTWHVDNRKCDRLLRHPADSLEWKKIDKEFPELESIKKLKTWIGYWWNESFWKFK